METKNVFLKIRKEHFTNNEFWRHICTNFRSQKCYFLSAFKPIHKDKDANGVKGDILLILKDRCKILLILKSRGNIIVILKNGGDFLGRRKRHFTNFIMNFEDIIL